MDNKKYVLVTGSTGGLGQAFVKELSKQNKNLLLCGTNDSKLENLKNQIYNENIDVITYAFDLSNENEIYDLVEFIKSKDIYIDLLINNAGFITEGSFEFASSETLTKAIKVNNVGTILLTKLILELNNYKDTNIITISSLAGEYSMPYMSIYSATKSLLTSFFTSINYELKHNNVNVLIVKPGAIPTSKEMKDAIKAQGFKGKLSSVSPEKIAKTALKKSQRKKKTYIPGLLNKLTIIGCKIAPKSLQVKTIGKMWQKSQKKRNIRWK